MTIEVRVPQLPESVADATLVSWHKKPGDTVARDENLVDLETDKVVLEVPAPTGGVLKELKADNGATVTSGQVLAILEETSGAAASAPGGAAGGKAAAAEKNAPAEKTAVAEKPAAAEKAAAATRRDDGAAQKLSPSVRRMVGENQLNPAQIPGSGKDGRITKSDVVTHLGQKPAAEAAPAQAKKPATPGAPVAPVTRGNRSEHRVAMTRLRARIADRMVQAQTTQALLTSFNEVDLKAVQDLRARYKEKFEKQHGTRLGFMSFFVKAAVEALKKFPVVNASVEGNDIIYHEYYDIGVAVSTERGLMVPILRDADQMSYADIEKSVSEFAGRARDGSITLEELTGGTFTITNGGVFGSLMSTPIVNSPQSAILGMHKIQDRPMVVDGQVVVRPMMYVALTYDHRIIDGKEAVQFLVAVKECLEDPARLMLQI
ncbi:MAG: 2-oxoglutarate dehydrogenase complex dihydrolipoyllysine-residue succinyltransferase [Gammaproteobacteria bacterium]|nr:2-oxoglutarate dehydrogenase complex dihydrolipoyllysine-residue succinyltransferase [Gammaproteobacteria bacterium]